MKHAVHQPVQLMLAAITFVLKTAETLWDWSWLQITAVLHLAWGDLPAWKLIIGIVAVLILGGALAGLALRAWDALGRIAAAFWTMALTLCTLLVFVVVAGLFSRGFQWVVASVPDRFWTAFI